MAEHIITHSGIPIKRGRCLPVATIKTIISFITIKFPNETWIEAPWLHAAKLLVSESISRGQQSRKICLLLINSLHAVPLIEGNASYNKAPGLQHAPVQCMLMSRPEPDHCSHSSTTCMQWVLYRQTTLWSDGACTTLNVANKREYSQSASFYLRLYRRCAICLWM